jgi:hypothetical protein
VLPLPWVCGEIAPARIPACFAFPRVVPTSSFDVGATRFLSSQGHGIRSIASIDASSK